MVLGPLRYYSGAWFEISVSNIIAPVPEHVFGVVVGRVLLYGVAHLCQALSKPHMTIKKRWASISIQVSWSLDQYAPDEVRGVYLEVMTWSVWLPNPVRHCPCLI